MFTRIHFFYLLFSFNISFLFSLCPLVAPAQTTLPTSWSFSGTPPNGWTTSGTNFYTASGNTPPALKFDNTGDWLSIFFADDPGLLSYYLTGNSFSGGTFTVEESVNGSSWTTLRTITAPPDATYSLYTDTPATGSRYIRFYYTNKATGNIGLDDVTLAIAPPGPVQEINVKQGAAGIMNGGTAVLNSPVGITTPDTFIIENTGTADTLFITNATISGADSADFTLVSWPDSVVPSGNGALIIAFTPAQAGTRTALLTIENNDTNENPYEVNLLGIGGGYASEPSVQPANLTFSNIKSYRFTVKFNNASPKPDGYLILRQKDSAITDVPADGIVYTRGDAIGNAKVAYCGQDTSFVPNNIVAGTDYYFAVFAYNGPGQYRNYLQSNPLAGSVTASDNMMPANEYTGISTASPSFITDLHNRINPHNSIFYGNYNTTMIPLFESRDTTGGQKVVTCIYSGYNYVYTEPFGWSVMSREHTYPHSWMPTYPADDPELPEYNDQHTLFPALFSNVNSIRSNYPLGEVVNITSQYLGCKFGKDVNGRNVFEPRDEHKGDAARALFYMAVCYNGVSGKNWAFPNPISISIQYGQDQGVLKRWHYQDPPDGWEIARNDFLDSLQENRNPFIDSMQFACYIDFLNMTMISTPPVPCNVIGIKKFTDTDAWFTVHPNPGRGEFKIQLGNKQLAVGNRYRIEVQNVFGSTTIPSTVLSIGEGELNALPFRQRTDSSVWRTGGLGWAIDLSSLTPGVYILKLTSGDFSAIDKLVIF